MINGYERLENGVIKQKNPKPYVYDKDYVIKTYDSSYGIFCDMMSYLRLGYITGVIKNFPKTVLDIGYGNGAFLKICQNGFLSEKLLRKLKLPKNSVSKIIRKYMVIR